MRIDVLGPLRLTVRGKNLTLPGRHTAAAFGYLTAQRGRAVPLAEVAAAASAAGTASGVRTVRNDLSRVAAQLPQGVLTVGSTALLTVAQDVIDADRFVELAHSAQAAWAVGEPTTCRTHCAAALDLWRGDPYPELAGSVSVEPTRRRLHVRYLEMTELSQEFMLADGVSFRSLAQAHQQAVHNPGRRGLQLQYARALHLAGRQVEALSVLRETVAALGDTALTRRIATLVARRDPAVATTPTVGDAGRELEGRQ